MAKPKLALIPAAQGDKFYSVLPSDGVGDFTFTRASTGTRIAPTGLIEEVASGKSRLNYDLLNGKVVNCPHYLLEPQSTNSVLYSQDVDNAYWLKANCVIIPNTNISPDGTLNADKLTVSSGTTGVLYRTSMTAGSLSFFAKDINLSDGKFRVSVDGVGIALWNKDGSLYSVTVTGGTGGTATNGINYGNGWFRFSFNVTSGSVVNYGIEGSIGESIFVFGLQNESSFTYPTSYIPTNGTAITRAAESANGSGDAATFNDSEGVLMAEIAALANDLTFRLIALKGTSDDIRFGYRTTSNAIYVDAPNAFLVATVNDIKTYNKVAIKYGATGTKFFINGFELGVDADDSSFSGIDTLDFDATGSSNYFFGKTRELQYFDSALTDAQLETLTSWTSLQEMITSQLYTNY